MILAVTGHRPSKLGGYSEAVALRLRALAIEELMVLKPEMVLTGMALGWDTAVADACEHLDIPFKAYVAFKGQEEIWPASSKKHFLGLLEIADEVKYVSSPGYEARKLLIRNIVMVEDCDQVLALWNGSKGGTMHCVRYAAKQLRQITNCWPRWSKKPAKVKEKPHCSRRESVEKAGPGYSPTTTDSIPF